MFRFKIHYLSFYKSKLFLTFVSKRFSFFDAQRPFEFCLPYCVLTFAKKDKKEVLEKLGFFNLRNDLVVPSFRRALLQSEKKLTYPEILSENLGQLLLLSKTKPRYIKCVSEDRVFFDEGEYLFYTFPNLQKERVNHFCKYLEAAYQNKDLSSEKFKRFLFERDETFFYLNCGFVDVQKRDEIFLDRGKQGPFVLKPEYASLFSFELAMERVSAKKCTLSSLFEHDPFYLNENYEEKTRDDFFNIYYYLQCSEFIDPYLNLSIACDHFYSLVLMSPPLPLFNVSYSWFSSGNLRRIYKSQFHEALNKQ